MKNMKINRLFLIGALPLISLTACVNEDLSKDTKLEKGTLDLNVEVQLPEKTRSIATNEFPINIYNSDGSIFQAFEKLEDVITPLTAPVGTYMVESHTPGEIQKRMSSPYYYGTETVDVQAGIKTKVLVTCKMANTSFKLNYTTQFLSTFSSWSVTIDDGGNDALAFTNQDGTVPNIVYWYFDQNVSELKLNFRGTTTKGNTVGQSFLITKDIESEGYVDDNRNFQGGDAIVINLDPTESTDGDITGLNLRANISFSETGEDVELKVIKKSEYTPVDPEGDSDDPSEPQGDLITLNLPNPISYAMFTTPSDKSIGDTYIAAKAGLKSIIVSITSTSDDMMSSVADLNDPDKAADINALCDFIKGQEVVGSSNVENLFVSLKNPLSVPKEGDTEYTFPIGNFFGFLKVLPGEHLFHLTVTDMDGNTKSGDVKITITQ